MKTLFTTVLAAMMLSSAGNAYAQTGAPASDAKNKSAGCASCPQKGPMEVVATRPLPGTNESMLVGRIENLMPIGVLAAMGCETCAGKAVAWAFEHGSTADEVERALRTIEAIGKLDCFRQQFGPEAATRLEKPLAAAREALRQATNPAAK